MDLINIIQRLLDESDAKVDLRPILPPSRQLAQIIAAYSNSGGGYVVLGAKLKPMGGFDVSGITLDFNATSITHKALDYLTPTPIIEYGYHTFHGRQVFILDIPHSPVLILLQGRNYFKIGRKIVDRNEKLPVFNSSGETKVKHLSEVLQGYKISQTLAKSKVLTHYQSSLKIIDNLGELLYPNSINMPAVLEEGKILTRILFSSVVDNFEIYLGDLLYEIWLSNPHTLKSSATVTLEQVLNCSDIEEFIIVYAREKISKMKKGSVKTFIEDNKLIRELEVFTPHKIREVDGILQIRHLFSHSNGIIDEQFLKNYDGTLNVGNDFLLTTDDFLNKLSYLAETLESVDQAAIKKYNLLTL